MLTVGIASGASGWSQDLALVHATVIASPDSPRLPDAIIVIRNGRIDAVGQHVAIPNGVERLDVGGAVVLAGFWNCHVHFTEPKWADAAHQPTASLEQKLEAMVTRSGFTTVVDTGSDPVNTVALRQRINAGEVRGPRIFTAGLPLYPPHALPYYLNDLPLEIRERLPQPATPADAVAAVRRNIAAGADLTKLFTGSIAAPNHIVPMSEPIAAAAVEEAHRHHQLVFSHCTNLEGASVAVDAGVDVLAHAPELLKGIDDAFLRRLVAQHVSMIPTLKLFSQDTAIADIRNVVFRFHRLGGVLMFGTDTGFMPDYDVSEEFRQLIAAGLGDREILAMLTTAPAKRFGVDDRLGRVAVGYDADLTILSGDPAPDRPLGFTQVAYAIARGRVIYPRTSRPIPTPASAR